MFRSGFVSLIGRPNVGKSTLLNALLGEKLAITSPKPQTTRRRIQGILTLPEEAQIVFIDTPGIHRPKHKLGEKMVKAAEEALEGIDAIILVIDAVDGFIAWDREIAELVAKADQPVLAVWNKVDAVGSMEGEGSAPAEGQVPVGCRTQLDQAMEAFRQQYPEWPTFAISALNGQGTGQLIAAVTKLLPENPPYFPDDILTDDPERVVVAELIREQALALLNQEVPHAVAVEVTDMKDRGGDAREYVAATIYVERESQKGIIIGNGGSMLKEIGRRARVEIEALLGRPVYLDLWVKVKKDWRDSDSKLRELGFQ
ncbi:MAG TPA: GTPase Era [Firmicutes bacterium]|jgi:GTP-binding protein Era|nr:GTPase Era [Bacillota bacterium]HBL67841.1 GTPase Era [Bacillota bacterium]